MGAAYSRVLLARLVVAGMVCATGAAGAAYVFWPAKSPTVPPISQIAAPAVTMAPDTRIAPSFDVVRVGPQGNAVLAGRAEPGATVVVTDGDATLGQTRADDRGEWVLTPGSPLAPGGRELNLSARTAAGLDVKGGDTVLLAVPAPVAAPSPVVALLVPPAGAPRVLQGAPVRRASPVMRGWVSMPWTMTITAPFGLPVQPRRARRCGCMSTTRWLATPWRTRWAAGP